MSNKNIGKEFKNINTNELCVLEKIDQKHVNSFTDIRNVYVIRNVTTNKVDRWSQSLFQKYFKLN